VNAEFGSNLSLATLVLSADELAAAGGSAGVARMQYGNALERLVARRIRNDPELSRLFLHKGGPSNPDFIGVGSLLGENFDITTPGQVSVHLSRPGYGPGLKCIIYIRHVGF
jgi:hypothetical protein